MCRGKVIILYLKKTLEAPGLSREAQAITMLLSLDDVRRIAQLARLQINDTEAEQVLAQLRAIFALIDELQAVDTRGVDPMSHAQGAALRLREDQVSEPDQRQLFQSIAPQVEAGLYLVPKVIE